MNSCSLHGMWIVIPLLVLSNVATAETWYCAVERRIEKYQVNGNQLIHLNDLLSETLDPKDRDEFRPKFQILRNNVDGIVAVLADASHDKGLSVFANVVLINKKTGQFRNMVFSAERKNGKLEPALESEGNCAIGN